MLIHYTRVRVAPHTIGHARCLQSTRMQEAIHTRVRYRTVTGLPREIRV